MCGINGLVLGLKEKSEKELRDIRETFSNLTDELQVRGRHATGVFVVNKTTGVEYFKRPINASEMTNTKQWWNMMQKITNDTVAVVGHVRYATTGDPSNNNNNHPIVSNIDANKNIIGVHNGVISNYCDVCKKFPYDMDFQEVDSASIFNMLATVSKKSKLTSEKIAQFLPELNGNFAIVVADARRLDSIFVARDADRPLVFWKDKSRDVMWLCSTGDIMRRGLKNHTIKPPMIPPYSVARLSKGHVSGGQSVSVTKWRETIQISEFSPMENPNEYLSDFDREVNQGMSDFWTTYNRGGI